MLMKDTPLIFETVVGAGINVKGQRSMAAPQLFKAKELNFEKLGIGGLDTQFEEIFRRAFQSRVLPPDLAERLGVPHVKGMLLHGPPGTGTFDNLAQKASEQEGIGSGNWSNTSCRQLVMD